MAEEVGIVMSLYDRVSPTLKAIAGNSKAFDKSLDDLEQSLKAYDKAQDGLTKKSADLKKALAEADNQVRRPRKAIRSSTTRPARGIWMRLSTGKPSCAGHSLKQRAVCEPIPRATMISMRRPERLPKE